MDKAKEAHGCCNERVNGKMDLDEGKCCGARIVKVHKPWHICMFLMSYGQPGAGCWWNACCCHAGDTGCQFGNLLYALVMAGTSICIIGYLNSMAFGVGIWRKSD